MDSFLSGHYTEFSHLMIGLTFQTQKLCPPYCLRNRTDFNRIFKCGSVLLFADIFYLFNVSDCTNVELNWKWLAFSATSETTRLWQQFQSRPGIFSHNSRTMESGVRLMASRSVHHFALTEISQQLFNELPLNFVETFLGPRWCYPVTLALQPFIAYNF